MKLRKNIAIFLIALLAFMPTQSVADFSGAAVHAISRVESEGYEIDSVTRTFLGRVKVISHNNEFQRETVFHAVTMEVLADRLVPMQRGSGRQSGGVTTPQGSNSGGSASTGASSSVNGAQSSTRGSATGSNSVSRSDSNSSSSNSTSTQSNTDGSTTTTTTNSVSSSASSSASSGN